MGVNGLWSLLSPVARPIALETLKDKRLAIDASIWLYQFQMAMRDRKTGDTLQGAHIMGTFRRVVKLLFHGIKPVFVFDGDAPMLKKRTIEKRRRRKQGAGRDLVKTAQQLLSAQLRNAAAEHALNRRRQAQQLAEQSGLIDTGDRVDEEAVYLEDLEAGKVPSPVKTARKDALRDEYALPSIVGPLEARAKASDPRIATEDELREFIEDLRPEDLDINSDFFGNLPTEVKYEILGDLRIKTRQVNHRRVQQMRHASTAIDFSRAQIDNLMERNLYTQKLLSVTDELGTAAIAIPTRVAGQRNREYILVKQDVSKGGGWVLGVKNPEVASAEPITIDTTTDESVGGLTDEEDFEEVGIKASEPAKNHLPTPDAESRRLLAVEAVRARYSSKYSRADADPYLDQPSVMNGEASSHLFLGDDDVELQEALLQSAELASRQTELASQAIQSRLPISAPTRRPPSASTSATRYAAAGDEPDDSMEYVEISASDMELHRRAAQQAPPDDTDDSDAFEEVRVAAPQQARPVLQAPIVATTLTGRKPLNRAASRAADAEAALALSDARASSGPPRPASPEQALPPPRNILDTLLSSDSESDAEEQPSSPPDHAPTPVKRGFALSSEVSAHDFAMEEQAFSIGPARPVRPLAFSRNLEDVISEEMLIRTASPVAAPVSTAEEPLKFELDVDQHPPPSVSNRPSPKLPSRSPSPLPSHVLSLPPSPTPPVAGDHDADVASSLAAEESLPSPETAPEFEAPTLPKLPVVPSPPSPASPPRQSPSTASLAVVPQHDHKSEEEFFAWSRSPTPLPQRRGSVPLFADASESEDEEVAREIEREADEYANMMSVLRNRKLEDMQQEARSDVAKLMAQRNTEQRNADSVTREMLALFGIPWIDAPQEAEAECASLLTRSLVDGIVTDDSDVFLFGGSRIYRNMFNNNTYVECYLLTDLERELGLDRDKLVRLAYLLGGDYTDGLPGVGPVLGRELLEEFKGGDGLKRFKEWWLRVQGGKDTDNETNTAWKRKFKKGHGNLVIDPAWPNPEIANAYYRPTVSESDERFSWAGPDIDGLRIYLARQLGWDQAKSDSILLPLQKHQKEVDEGKAKQVHITDFFDPSAGYDDARRHKQSVQYGSKRLQKVLQSWKQQQAGDGTLESDAEDQEEEEEDKPAKKRKKSAQKAPKEKAAKRKPPAAPRQPKKSPATSRKRQAREARDARAEANGGVYLSDEELGDVPAPPRRLQAPRKSKTKKKVVETASDVEADDE
ncbi:hypothetical protein JCM21900_003443 [Sporobolomyces salmonicolor]